MCISASDTFTFKSPVGVTTPYGVTIPPPTLTADITNGGWVACDVFQTMYDLLWEPPGCNQSSVVPPNFPPPPLAEALNGYPSRVTDCTTLATVTPATDPTYPHPLPSGVGFPPYPTSVNIPKMPNGVQDPYGWPWQRCPSTIPTS